MKLQDLENYRNENGEIDMDEILKYHQLPIMEEKRGASNRDKFWIALEDAQILLRTENLDECGVEYSSYTELIMEELAKQVGIENAHYDVITYHGKRGVISVNVVDKEKNECLITVKELVNSVDEDKVFANEPIDMIRILKSIKKMAQIEGNISEKDVKIANMDLCRSVLFQIFTMATDGHAENMAYIYGSDNQKGWLKLAPLFDNEISLMLDQPKDGMDRMLKDSTYLEKMMNYQNQMITVPDEDKVEVNDWEDMLYYLIDESDELNDFAEQCYEKLNIHKAITAVENRIKVSLPDRLKEFVSITFGKRKEALGKDLGLDYKEEEALLSW